MLEKPYSAEAFEALKAAYEALDEKQKCRITKFTADSDPKRFKYWVSHAITVGGADIQKVKCRQLQYGRQLDKCLFELEDGAFCERVLESFFDDLGMFGQVILPDEESLSDRARLVEAIDAGVGQWFPGNPFARLLGVFAKCFAEVDDLRLREASSLPIAAGSESARDAGDDALATASRELNLTADQLEGWAKGLRDLQPIDRNHVMGALDHADKHLAVLAAHMETLAKEAGVSIRPWQSAEQCRAQMEELKAAVAAKQGARELADFLTGLAKEIRRLAVTHRSKLQQKRLGELRDSAGVEIEQAAAASEAEWIADGPRTSADWLPWAFGLDAQKLEDLQESLSAVDYPQLAELVGLGELSWLAPADSGVAAPASQPLPTPPPPTSPSQPAAAEKETPPVHKVNAPPAVAAPVPPRPRPTPPPPIAPAPTTAVPPAAPPRPAVVRVEAPKPVPVDQPMSETADALREPRAPDHAPSTVVELSGMALKVTDAALRRSLLAQLAWRWLAENEAGLAFHLAARIHSDGAPSSSLPPLPTLKLLLLKPWLAEDRYEVTAAAAATVESMGDHPLGDGASPELQTAAKLLLTAASLSPMLLAPSCGVGRLMSRVYMSDSGPLAKFVTVLAAFSDKKVGITRDMVASSLQGGGDVGAKATDCSERAAQWLVSAKSCSLNYAPATQVLHEWVKVGGVLHKLLTPVASGKSARATEVAGFLARLDIQREVDTTQNVELRRRTRIEGKALKALLRKAEEAVEIAKGWLSCVSDQSSFGVSGSGGHIRDLRRQLEQLGGGIRSELGELIADQSLQSEHVRIGARTALDAIEEVLSIVNGAGWPPTTDLPLADILGLDVLRLPASCLTDASARGGVLKPAALDELLARAAAGTLGYEHAFREYCDRGAHGRTHKFLTCLRAAGRADVVRALDEQREQSISEWVKRLREEAESKGKRLHQALSKGSMAAEEFNRHHAAVESLLLRLEQVGEGEVDFQADLSSLDEVGRAIDVSRQRELNRVETRLSALADISAEVRKRIADVIGSGDVFLADDYMDRVSQSEPLPGNERSQVVDRFADFWGESGPYTMIESFVSQRPLRAQGLVAAVKSGTACADLDLKDGRPADAAYALALENWFQIRYAGRPAVTQESITAILRGLGFQAKGSVRPEPGAPGPKFLLETTDIVECPLPNYGSGARKQYLVAYAGGAETAQQVVNQAKAAQGDTRSVIVLLFGRLSRAERRALISACERAGKNVVVVDDILMVYLAGITAAQRLHALFECSLPFTNINPYCITANPLPPEMFFGRQRACDALIAMGAGGSCFVYGGRQIGKTVLLTTVQRRVHTPATGQIAHHIDLKARQLGTHRQPSELWAVIAEVLRASTPALFDGAKIPSTITYKWLSGEIRRWLDGGSTRRILLLLDEADAFLAADGSHSPPYAECDSLRDLMAATHQRFKAVLAGLHNVQRATRVGNQPLAHFGPPICVGPLMNNGEARKAYDLVVRPLATLGIRFETEDLPYSVLARTNYYPNLIQIYCQSLLHHVRDRQQADGSLARVPYVVTTTDLDEVYEGREMREELREKFKLTLDLDPRFRLIANILALGEEEHPAGRSVDSIRGDALDWWCPGFSQGDGQPITHDAFRNLLNEMVGLGILRTTKDDLYSLRSANVLLLIGSKEAIGNDLLEASGWEVPSEYAAGVFHAQMSEEPSVRSPLTAEQEGRIAENTYSVDLIAGCRASGVDDLGKALAHRFGASYHQPSATTLDGFLENLTQASKERDIGKTIFFVPDDVPWTLDWTKRCSQHLSRLRKADAYMGAIFCAGPRKLWEFRKGLLRVESGADSARDGADSSVPLRLHFLHPWHDDAVKDWLPYTAIGKQNAEVRKTIHAATGNWHWILNGLARARAGGKALVAVLAEAERLSGSWCKGVSYESLFGLADCSKALPVLSFFMDNPGMLAEDLCSYGDTGLTLAEAHEVIWWAERLDLMHADGAGWAVNPYLGKVIKAQVAKG